MSTLSSLFLPSRPSPNPMLRLLNPPRTPPLTLCGSLRLTSPLSASPDRKWRYACVGNGDSSFSEDFESNFIEEKLPKEPVEPESDHLPTSRVSGLQKITDKLFDPEPWTVPWTGKTTMQVMLLWFASFWLVKYWIIPFIAHTAGLGMESLTHRGQAIYSLFIDVAEGLVGIAILRHFLSRFHPLPSDWFRFSLEGKWQVDVGLGCLTFPLVYHLLQFNMNLIPVVPSTPITISSVQQSNSAPDPVAIAIYAVVVSVIGPIWEEVVFRGFLLPSLTKYMPVWCSILLTSVLFSLAHLNMWKMLPVVFLGVVMGAVFARSRNLLVPVLLHSLWNAFILIDLIT